MVLHSRSAVSLVRLFHITNKRCLRQQLRLLGRLGALFRRRIDRIACFALAWFENDSYAEFLVSDDLEVVLEMKINGDGLWTVYDGKDGVFMELTPAEAFQTEFLRYDGKRELVYFLDNRSTDTNQLTARSLKGDETVLGHQVESDVNEVLFVGGEPKAYASYYTRKKWP